MSDDEKLERLTKLIQTLYRASDELNLLFKDEGRRFTLDGHLLGSIGEVLAKFIFDLRLEKSSTEAHDAITSDGKHVQVKLTGVGSGISLSGNPDFLIAFQLSDNGLELLYNGEGGPVNRRLGKPQKNGQRRISMATLRELNKTVTTRIPQRRPLPQIKRRNNIASLS